MKRFGTLFFLALLPAPLALAQQQQLQLSWDEMDLCLSLAEELSALASPVVQITSSLHQKAPDQINFETLQVGYFTQLNVLVDRLDTFESVMPQTLRRTLYEELELIEGDGTLAERIFELGYEIRPSGDHDLLQRELIPVFQALIREPSAIEAACESNYPRRNE